MKGRKTKDMVEDRKFHHVVCERVVCECERAVCERVAREKVMKELRMSVKELCAEDL